MKIILQYVLNFLVRGVLRKYHPEIIGITGSVGKTSAKEAIFAALSGRFNVRRAFKNYNNELGVPLTILGCESGNQSIFKWLHIIVRGLRLIFLRELNYPQILVLEMGADKPGDIKYLTKLAPCQIGVLTAIGPTHLETFKTVRQVAQEKQLIVSHLKKNGLAILNADDEIIFSTKEKITATVLTFGLSARADIKAEEIKIMQEIKGGELTLKGVSFKINYQGSLIPVILLGVLGKQSVYAALAAAAVGLRYGLNLVEISERLKFFQSPSSRMRVLDGIKQTVLIDDSYNSSPLATQAALDVFSEIKVNEPARKFAVLGEMLELGAETEKSHQEIGKKVTESGVDFLVTVGERAKIIAETAIKNGFNEDKVVKFGQAEEAGRFLQEKIQRGDLILIKGSQGVRMEKVVVELMAEPLRAAELACRQDEGWREK